MCACACARVCVCVFSTHAVIDDIKDAAILCLDLFFGLAPRPHQVLINGNGRVYVFVRACVCVCACVRVCACVCACHVFVSLLTLTRSRVKGTMATRGTCGLGAGRGLDISASMTSSIPWRPVSAASNALM